MFGNKELKEEVERLTAVETSLNEKISALQEEVESLSAHKEANATLQASNKELNEKVEELNGKLEEQSEKLESFDEKVEATAINQVASIGHEPVKATEEDDKQISANLSLSEQYMSIKDPKDKFNFYKENKEQLKKSAFSK